MKASLILSFFCYSFYASDIECRENIRGISPSLQPFYRPAKDFRCLDGSQIIPYERVNDDYCDCSDGTDEPGTSACPNGSFYCINTGYKADIIPSSRVNDGICDCCDGSDEYSQRVVCKNSCSVLGQKMREQEVKQHQLLIEGHKIYNEYCQQGQQAMTEKENRLVDLERERNELDVKRAELEALKNEAEKPEKEVKDLHNQQWEAEKEKRKEEKKRDTALEAFKDLDEDQNNFVSVQEIQKRLEFDIDSNGEVSDDEAKEYLEEHDEIGFEDFLLKVWDNISQIYRKSDAEKPSESEYNEAKEAKNKEPEDEDLPVPDYDEAAKQLIAAADAARNEFNAADSKFRDAETEIGEIKRLLEFDLGPRKEFYPLKGKCFEYSDREYVYTLCPFERASQKNKHGGGETSLGTWGLWSGSSDFKYSTMKYERGQNCWNGPDRSARVELQCGLTNELVSVSEPNRCEYKFVFNTPAICSQEPEPLIDHPTHEDL